MILPNGLNQALMNQKNPFGKAAEAIAENARNMSRLEKIAKAAELDPRAKAAAVGNMLSRCRVGVGPNGNAELVKRAQDRSHYPLNVRSDSPERRLHQHRVNNELAKMRGHPGHPKMPDFLLTKAGGVGSFGVGKSVRTMKAVNDSNMPPGDMPVSRRNLPMLPGTGGIGLNEDALQILNALPDARVRQSIIGTILSRPPQSPNDSYRWTQSIVALRSQINELCAELNLDPTALTDLLDRKVDFYDPNSQSAPATPPAHGRNISPYPDDPEAWPDELDRPAEPVDPGGPQHRDRQGGFLPGQRYPFAGADRTDLNPDFSGEHKLAKFYDYYAKRGVDITKGEAGSRQQLEHFGRMVVKSEIGGALQKWILLLHDARKQLSAGSWAKVMREPRYQAILKAIHDDRGLSRSMMGAALALIC
jgi:hypothetical protein